MNPNPQPDTVAKPPIYKAFRLGQLTDDMQKPWGHAGTIGKGERLIYNQRKALGWKAEVKQIAIVGAGDALTLAEGCVFVVLFATGL